MSGPSGGAEHLARIHGTEEDKVNCPFYYKIGACRHGKLLLFLNLFIHYIVILIRYNIYR